MKVRFLSGLLALASSGCESDTILLATVEPDAGTAPRDGSLSDAGAVDGATSMDAAAVPGTCVRNEDCAPQDFCSFSACEAARGVCERRTPVCGATQAPVCGCDGIVYFNDCLRRLYGVRAAAEGTCTRGFVSCGGSDDAPCPNEASCGRLELGPSCSGDMHGSGQCWVLPSTCGDQALAGDRFSACDGPPSCTDACTAIGSQRPHMRVARCLR